MSILLNYVPPTSIITQVDNNKKKKASLVQGVFALEIIPDEKDCHPGSNEHGWTSSIRQCAACASVGRTSTVASTVQLEDYLNYRLDFEKLTWFFFQKPSCISHDYQWLQMELKISESGDVKPLFQMRPVPGLHLPYVPVCIVVDKRAYHDAYDEWESKYRWPLIPEPEPFAPPNAVDEENKIKISLRGRTLQVIVKLANIVLTPENPKYAGGSWHVEGMANENIVATGLYYYACENITESRLDFRTAIGADDEGRALEHLQDDDQGFLTAFGLQRPMNQYLGYVVADEGKCVAFPNVYQHRVDESELADPTKPGYRKVLCFVVNLFVCILSKGDLPPQQVRPGIWMVLLWTLSSTATTSSHRMQHC
ncbi:hypothetical protein DICSQDRAFT_171809 [Dichomitus squalens LYAD-421 SS1]|uniref:DUF4246 domain-containing protein n=1 Tax=Dichomitus squalens (strain LYAD-421) TaxID=732165 RepID=R7SV35_DICSQ|nr:uncharacterized protein DICSQDRAFT_171809 [Dichomitus squalens LYAD-421 SS1]EJF59630.1 hypothetical protein DICSQDRAFT_171809 [Dichomitus squalens LYAD-421 SS1]